MNIFGPTLEGNGLTSLSYNGLTVITGFGQDATFTGDDANTTLVCVGRGNVTAIFGDGDNFAKGGLGDDAFIGGNGYNRLLGGGGDDLLIGGSGTNDLSGGWGDDALVFGQWDTVFGGPGADIFVFLPKEAETIIETPPTPPTGPLPPGDTVAIPEWYLLIGDFNAIDDELDLSMSDIDKSMLKAGEDELLAFTPDGIIHFLGVTLVGTIDEAIADGTLWVNDFTGGGKG